VDTKNQPTPSQWQLKKRTYRCVHYSTTL